MQIKFESKKILQFDRSETHQFMSKESALHAAKYKLIQLKLATP